MEIKIRPEWDLDDPANIDFNADGSIKFKGPVGNIFLPDDYLKLLQTSNGIGLKDKESWFLGHFPNGPVILEVEWIGALRNAMLSTWGYFDNEDHGKPLLPKGFIFIGVSYPHYQSSTKGKFDILLCCLKDHRDYGKVFVWPHSDAPWMEGDNTIGLGFVADSFTAFMNNLAPRDSL